MLRLGSLPSGLPIPHMCQLLKLPWCLWGLLQRGAVGIESISPISAISADTFAAPVAGTPLDLTQDRTRRCVRSDARRTIQHLLRERAFPWNNEKVLLCVLASARRNS
jgi:hypothetical protein